jgi:hypothetical protein
MGGFHTHYFGMINHNIYSNMLRAVLLLFLLGFVSVVQADSVGAPCNTHSNGSLLPALYESWKEPELSREQCDRCARAAVFTITLDLISKTPPYGRVQVTKRTEDSVRFIVNAARRNKGFIALSYNRELNSSRHAILIEGETLILQRKEDGVHFPLIEIDLSNLK